MEMTKDMYSSELKKIAWRLQYRCKVSANKEFGMVFDINSIESFESSSVSKFFVQDIFNLINNEVGKKIIHAIYLDGKSEKEVALELQISQQAVNKWKKKTLKMLSMKLSS
ncbi:sigma-70 family RNA polymerase sigma factor [Paenibacillus taichungensis]|uniref:Sigma-70 family RNA polymerase sigma factor n=1 Tax=Paenibacillus taichungensis TaxID=484184 RepID=A0ABX2ML68_9BACL|nr:MULTISPECIES: sigma-70 family RNA polymerase sigma factor [Paenibacillus]NUU54792.1 sigma-70 family RNA polymerase sigma factor [Paenibacillus taichungensis]SEB27617.1 hypothetical protein SAMN03159332_6283 [Paenibacillus sp. 276b]